MLSRTQKLEALKQFLEDQAFARVDGHDAHDGYGCNGHDEAFTAKAQELLALIEDENYGYEPRLVEAYHKVWGGGRKTPAYDEFMNSLTEEQFGALRRLNPGETFSLLTYDNGTTTFEVNSGAAASARIEEIRKQIHGA